MIMQNLYAIPAELRALRQFVLWKYVDVGAAKPTKIPYQINGEKADVTNPFTWSRFEEVFNALGLGGYDGIGFVFTANDPYTFIDLDYTDNSEHHQRQIKIYHEFDSYSELSPSGKGLHIIVKGQVPQGRRRDSVEVYSSARYATMTGHVYNDKPIFERQQLLDQLFSQMGAPPVIQTYTGNEPEREDDASIVTKAKDASNGEKFTTLYNGDWQRLYASQSEADFALIDIVAFYTQNRNQIVRIFRASGLGKRDKAKRQDYVNGMIQRSFDRLAPPIDFDGFRIALEEKIANDQSLKTNLLDSSSHDTYTDIDNSNIGSNQSINTADSPSGKATDFDSVTAGSSPASAANGSVAQRLVLVAHNGSDVGSNPTTSTIPVPPGLVGEIAQFIYQAAPRPVPEIAIAGALGLMAGICGRAYNISGTGLNQYILCLAMTGAGKEAMASGIDRIMHEVVKQVPVANEFIGPSRIASGQALYKYMAGTSQCFVSIIGEFGKRLESMSSKNANSAEKQLIVELLDLYNKSGFGQTSKPSIYSDKDKNTLAIQWPSFTILGESTPDTFYSVLTEEMISDGLLPRFMLIEYKGNRPALNENHLSVYPPDWLVNKVAELAANCKSVMAARKVNNVERSPEAAKMLQDFDKTADSHINATDKEVIRQLWNRAHIKVLKIAALLAVGRNYINPCISVDDFVWARDIVENDIRALAHKFDEGTVGKSSDEIKQMKDIQRVIKQYVTEPCPKIADQRMHSNKVVSHSFLSTRLYSMAAFRNDRIGQKVSVDRAVKVMLESGWLINIPETKMLKDFGSTVKAYQVGPMKDILK